MGIYFPIKVDCLEVIASDPEDAHTSQLNAHVQWWTGQAGIWAMPGGPVGLFFSIE